MRVVWSQKNGFASENLLPSFIITPVCEPIDNIYLVLARRWLVMCQLRNHVKLDFVIYFIACIIIFFGNAYLI